MRKQIFISLFLILFCAAGLSAQNGKLVSLKARLDSAAILMGNKTAIHVELIGNLDGTGYFVPNDTMWRDVEMSGSTDPVINDLGNGRKELLKDIIIQAFDSGLYTLPPIAYVQGSDTMYANALTLKVIPVNVDSLMTVHDFAGVESPGSNFFDFVPDWLSDYGLWIILGLILIGVITYLIIVWRKKGRLPLVPQRKPVPPYQEAITALEQLNNRKLCDQGKEREFYTELTEILRHYLSRRFGINAMEMTSSQILRALNDNEETRLSREKMEQVLEVADFVKFAKVRPLPDDNVAAFRNAVAFVENTKPVEQPEETAPDNGSLMNKKD